MIENIVCRNGFERASVKFLHHNKHLIQDLKATIQDLVDLNRSAKNLRKSHPLSGKLSGYRDVHFITLNNDYILVYRIVDTDTLLLLELQTTTNHDSLSRVTISQNLTDYDVAKLESKKSDNIKEDYDVVSRKNYFALKRFADRVRNSISYYYGDDLIDTISILDEAIIITFYDNLDWSDYDFIRRKVYDDVAVLKEYHKDEVNQFLFDYSKYL